MELLKNNNICIPRFAGATAGEKSSRRGYECLLSLTPERIGENNGCVVKKPKATKGQTTNGQMCNNSDTRAKSNKLILFSSFYSFALFCTAVLILSLT